MKRDKIESKYKWDLTKIVKDEKEYQYMVDKVKELTSNIVDMKGTILSSKKNFKKYLELSNEMNLNLEKLYIYSYLLYYSDTTNTLYKEKSLIAEKLNEDVSNKLSFVDTEILSKTYEAVLELLNEEDTK